MSENPNLSTPDQPAVSAHRAVISDYATADTEFRELQAPTWPKLKPILFNALKAAGITRVTVNFDGSGDSGQIESVEARDGANNPMELPAETITYPSAVMEPRYESCSATASGQRFVGYEVHEVEKTAPLQDVIEEIFWDFIGAKHGGWENNDGGFGECHFNVDEGVIRLEMNERYTETSYYEHEM
ncbi:MAG: hypothetical protein PHT60_14090 [Acidiphilium sp.]|nr:hypothetical protein [Acidiphilium sp.]MDD4936896.1 hypothetical protein [Acidiphilium sp.]